MGSAVAERLRELAHLRNAAARALGHRDHFALSLATAELDEDHLLRTLAAVDDATRARFAEWKAGDDAARAERFGVPVARAPAVALRRRRSSRPRPAATDLDLDPWFVDGDQVELTRATYAGIGLDVDGVLARSDLLPRAGKSQHAFCIDVDRGEDVRVLCNNVPGEYWTETMLHEFGHAVYDLHVDADLPWLVRTMHPLTTEGVAMLFGRLTLDVEWLTTVAGVAPGRRRGRGACAGAPSPHHDAGVRALGPRDDPLRTRALRGSRRRSRHRVVGPRRALPAADPPRRPARARLGGEDPRGARARLLPELPAR